MRRDALAAGAAEHPPVPGSSLAMKLLWVPPSLSLRGWRGPVPQFNKQKTLISTPLTKKSVFPKRCLSEWSQSTRQSSGLPRLRAVARLCSPLDPKATPAQLADPPSRPNPEWRAAPVSRSSKRAGLEGSDLFSSFVNPWHTQKSRFGCRTEENKGKGGKQRKRWKTGCHDNMDATKGPRHICSSITWSGGAQHVSAGLEQRGDTAGRSCGESCAPRRLCKGRFPSAVAVSDSSWPVFLPQPHQCPCLIPALHWAPLQRV